LLGLAFAFKGGFVLPDNLVDVFFYKRRDILRLPWPCRNYLISGWTLSTDKPLLHEKRIPYDKV